MTYNFFSEKLAQLFSSTVAPHLLSMPSFVLFNLNLLSLLQENREKINIKMFIMFERLRPKRQTKTLKDPCWLDNFASRRKFGNINFPFHANSQQLKNLRWP